MTKPRRRRRWRSRKSRRLMRSRRAQRTRRLGRRVICLAGLSLMLALAVRSFARPNVKTTAGECTTEPTIPTATVTPKSVNIGKETIAPVPSAEPTTSATNQHEAEDEYLIWFGWTFCESGEESWELTGSDGGHAYGRYQFDDRHCLADFFRFCVKENRDDYESFTTFYYVDGGGESHIQNTERIAEEWSWICFLKGEDFYEMQTRFAVEYYYETAKQTMKQSSIDIDDYGPVLRGTIMSLAIRNGAYAKGLSSAIATYHDKINEKSWLEAIYAAEARRHPDQVTRWKVRQKNAALQALTKYNKGTSSLEELDVEPVQHQK